MGLSILMQNVALMALSADLQGRCRRSFGGTLVHLRPVLRQARIAHRLWPSRSRCTLGLRFMLQATYLGKAIRAHRAGRGSGAS